VTFVLLILAVGDSEPARRDGKVAKWAFQSLAVDQGAEGCRR
jgi:hypothetical protein